MNSRHICYERSLHRRTTSTIAGSTASGKLVVDTSDPNLRGLGSLIPVKCRNAVADEARGTPRSALGPEALASTASEHGNCASWTPFDSRFRGGSIFLLFLPFITWLRMDLRNSGLGFSRLFDTTNCSPAIRREKKMT